MDEPRGDALLAPGQSPAEESAQAPTRPESAAQQALPRDAVTGRPLDAEALYQLTIRNRILDDGRPLPTQLHVSRPMPFRGRPQDRKYWHGGPDWSHALTRRIGGAAPAAVEAAERAWREWWTNDYVVARIRLRIGHEAMAAILAWKLDGVHYTLVTRQFRKGDQWLEMQLRKATGIVRADFLTKEDRPKRRRPD